MGGLDVSVLTMKNIFGEDREPQKLEITKEGKTHVVLKRDGKLVGLVYKNGWNGYSRLIDFPVGEPIFDIVRYEKFSLSELNQVIAAMKEML